MMMIDLFPTDPEIYPGSFSKVTTSSTTSANQYFFIRKMFDDVAAFSFQVSTALSSKTITYLSTVNVPSSILVLVAVLVSV